MRFPGSPSRTARPEHPQRLGVGPRVDMGARGPHAGSSTALISRGSGAPRAAHRPVRAPPSSIRDPWCLAGCLSSPRIPPQNGVQRPGSSFGPRRRSEKKPAPFAGKRFPAQHKNGLERRPAQGPQIVPPQSIECLAGIQTLTAGLFRGDQPGPSNRQPLEPTPDFGLARRGVAAWATCRALLPVSALTGLRDMRRPIFSAFSGSETGLGP